MKLLIKEGQMVYVNEKKIFDENPPNLTEYVVVKSNKNSFYAIEKDSKNPIERRFSQKGMTCKGHLSHFWAYISREEYWSMVQEQEEKKNLLHEIKTNLSMLDTQQLRKIKSLILNGLTME
jgi:hypothetical protein